MISFISSFKPVFIALLLVAAVEAAVHQWGSKSDYNSNFFEFSPFREEKLQKFIIYDKFFLSGLASRPSDIMQVGDSSGLFGIKPKMVETQLHGLRYVNLGCCGDTGWKGYYDQAKLALRMNPEAKMLLLHVGPMLLPGDPRFNSWHPLNTSLHDHLLGPWRFFTLPSMHYRWKISRFIEFGQFDEPEIISTQFDESWNAKLKHLEHEDGWLPMPVDPATRPVEAVQKIADRNCEYEKSAEEVVLLGATKRRVLYPWLVRFAELAKDYNVKLAVVFGPVPCQREKIAGIDAIEDEVRRFQKEYPDVFIPHSMVNTYPLEDMADQIHLWPHATADYSKKLGGELSGWLTGKDGASGPYAPAAQ
jgi:hypothetical protein